MSDANAGVARGFLESLRNLRPALSGDDVFNNLRSGDLVSRYYLQSLARDLLPDERVCSCCRSLLPVLPGVNDGLVDVMQTFSDEGVASAYYRGLMRCGSVWHCPVCSVAISQGRRAELEAVTASVPGRWVLVTYTLRHTSCDNLADTLNRLTEAYRRLRSGRWWQNFVCRWGWSGSVRGLEVTYGSNGWHPHIHELALVVGERPFLDDDDEVGIESELSGRWLHVLGAEGAEASADRGCVVRLDASERSGYLSKIGNWSMAAEVAKNSAAQGRDGGGLSPWSLLAYYGAGSAQAGALFVEYAEVFRGRRALVWSRGFRAALGLDVEETDLEAADEDTPEARLLASLTPLQWRVVLVQKKRGELLRVAATGDQVALWRFLDALTGMPVTADYDRGVRAQLAQSRRWSVGDVVRILEGEAWVVGVVVGVGVAVLDVKVWQIGAGVAGHWEQVRRSPDQVVAAN